MDVALLAVVFVGTFIQMMLAMYDLGKKHAVNGLTLNGWLHFLSWTALTSAAFLFLTGAIS